MDQNERLFADRLVQALRELIDSIYAGVFHGIQPDRRFGWDSFKGSQQGGRSVPPLLFDGVDDEVS